MRRYAILGSLLILGMALAGRAVSLAQKPSPTLAIRTDQEPRKEALKSTNIVAMLPNVPIVDEPTTSASTSKTEGSRVEETVATVTTEPPVLPAAAPELPSMPAEPPSAIPPSLPAVDEAPPPQITQTPTSPAIAARPGEDPMGAVDSFLDRNRKEAENSIQALNQEAEILRARLQKVEAALARWQDVSKALKGEGSLAQGQSTPTQLEPVPSKGEEPSPTPATAASKPPRWTKPTGEAPPTEVKLPDLNSAPESQPKPKTPAVETNPLPTPSASPAPTPTTSAGPFPPPVPAEGPAPELPTGPAPSPTPVPAQTPVAVPTPTQTPDSLPSLPEPTAPALPPGGAEPPK
jgi:hypothetical protein